MPKDKDDKKTKDLSEKWPKRKAPSQAELFKQWEAIHPGKRPPFWEWCHNKQTRQW